jgi:molybdate transport system substrate-binding protein
VRGLNWKAGFLLACVSFFVCGTAQPSELKLLSPKAMTPVLTDLVPQFERSSGHKVSLQYGSDAELTKRIEGGEVADVAILSVKAQEQLAKQGRITGTVVIAKVGFGLIIRKDAARPDINSAQAFKNTLLAAKSIATGDPATSASGKYLVEILERLGIAAEVKSKLKTFPSGTDALAAVGNGDAELGMEITSAATGPNIELAGLLPSELQQYSSYAAGVIASANSAEVAKSFLAYVTSPASQALFKANGFDLPGGVTALGR